jgi:hypothetical protein
MLLSGVTLLVGVLLGYLGGGRLERVGTVRLRLPWLLGAALAAQVALAVLAASGAGARPLARGLLAVSLVAVIGFVWANRDLPGMWLALAGVAANAAVIGANGAMPVSREAIAYLGGEAAVDPGKHRLLEDGDALWWLADVIPVPGLRIVVSVGDIVLAAGVGIFVNRVMRGPVGRHAAPYGNGPTSDNRL